MKTKQTNKYNIFVMLFIVLNSLATYFVTTSTFNKYITTFNFTLRGFFNSFVGNVAFLLLIVTLLNLISKNNKKKMISMIIISFLLSGILFAINIYNRYYATSFTFKAFAIFKNPAESMGFTIFFESMRELITYFRIILFIPFMVLLVCYFIFKKDIILMPVVGIRINLITSMGFVLLFCVNFFGYSKIANEIKIVDSAKATHSTQNIGIYSHLITDALGYDFTKEVVDVDPIEIYKVLNEYNKNQDSYQNYLNGETYSKNVELNQIANISGKLVDNLNSTDSITGILKDYNLVLIHLETFNKFLIDSPIINKHLYNLKFLLSESYVFENFYSNVGLGNSSDAELSVLTGLYANGTSTAYWDYDSEIETKNFDFQTLPKLFNEINYNTQSYHGNDESFYNRNVVHPQMMGFNKFNSRETLLNESGKTITELQEQYEHETGLWLSDRVTFDYLNNHINEDILKQEPFFKFVITMLPHLPFHYDPYYPNSKETDLYDQEFINNIDFLSLKYFNFVKYYNDIFKYIFEDVDGYGDKYIYDENNIYNRNKTAYIFYGDHGSGIDVKDVNYLYNDQLTTEEAKAKLLQTISFIYVPGEKNVTKEIDGNSVTFKEGLLKGSQPLVRDQQDLYRTIIDLFDLPIKENDYLFGAHGMSNEPSYALDNKSLNIVTDAFLGNLNRNQSIIYDLNYTEIEIKKIKEAIINFKKASDYAINNNLFKR